jgi:hypothetical protein
MKRSAPRAWWKIPPSRQLASQDGFPRDFRAGSSGLRAGRKNRLGRVCQRRRAEQSIATGDTFLEAVILAQLRGLWPCLLNRQSAGRRLISNELIRRERPTRHRRVRSFAVHVRESRPLRTADPVAGGGISCVTKQGGRHGAMTFFNLSSAPVNMTTARRERGGSPGKARRTGNGAFRARWDAGSL